MPTDINLPLCVCVYVCMNLYVRTCAPWTGCGERLDVPHVLVTLILFRTGHITNVSAMKLWV